MFKFEILVATTVVFAFVLLQPGQISAQQLPDLTMIGSIGNKSFYTTGNRSLEANWFQAKSICQSWELEFGMLKTVEEFDYLRSLYPGNTATIWIDGHIRGMDDFNSRPAFVNGDGSEFLTKNFHLGSENFLCTYFSANENTFTDFCVTGSHRILCQSIATS